MPLIELNQVSKSFGSDAAQQVLRDIDLEIEEGEFVAVIGFSGSGKSTLLNLIAGLHEPTSGDVRMDGRPVSRPSPERGVVFQNYSLLPWLTVQGNVELAVAQVFPEQNRAERREQAMRYIKMVNLAPAKHKYPRELSGGMRQRVSLARTLATQPRAMLMDEPLSALDALTRAVLQDEILGILEQERKTVFLITNDVDEGLLMADRIIPLTMGPGATLGPAFTIDLPRPRDRKSINRNDAFKRLRHDITAFLLDEKRKQQELPADAAAVVLPDIEPEAPTARSLFNFSRRLRRAFS